MRFILTAVSAALVVGGYALTRYQLWPAYRTWSIDRMNLMARDFIATDDPRNALLTVRKVLGKRPNNAEAWKLGAKAADMRSSPEAVNFQRNLCRVEKAVANQMELIRLALKYEMYTIGLEGIQAISSEAKDLPEYHRLAAETYRRIHRDAAAKDHLISLLALTPGDRAASLALAEAEFAADPNHLPSDWAARVASLASDQDWSLRATVLQLRSAVVRKAASEAAELAVRVLARSDLDMAARLYVLEASYLYDPPAAGRMLTTLQNQVAARPDEVVRLMDFLLGQGKFAAIQNWYVLLPEAVRQDERVKFTTAQACRALRDWAGMEKLLRGPRWTKEEPLRLGLLAYSYRMAGRAGDFSETWKLAVNATGQDARQIMVLLRHLEQWHWDEERYDLLWKLFNLMPATTSVQDLLVAHEYHAGNTINLNRIYARVIEASPGDEDALNNFAYTSLLLGTNENRARQIARELHVKHPENALYLTTYTLALHKQGSSQEALGLVQKLGPADRSTPSAMLHEAIYAAAAGQADRAGQLLKALPPGNLLPEERRLAEETKEEITRLAANRERQSKPVAAAGESTSGNGWLELLPVRPTPVSADLNQADALFREKNFTAMRTLLIGAKWARDEHLRFALLAFVEREQAHGRAADDFWRQAFVSAGRDLPRLRDLQNLAAHWNWTDEGMAIADRVFESGAMNAAMPEGLLDYYRRQARTTDLARLYWRYVERTNSTGPEAAWCVYYNLLCGMNVTFAQTLAERVYAAAPKDPRCKMAYAFSLWRQQRAGEAWPFIQDMDAQELAGMQVQLVAAGVLIDLGRVEDARNRLGKFSKENALPEEINLAETLSRKLGLVSAALASATK